MSREEKEEAYNKARERIFGTTSTEISTPGKDLAHFQVCPKLTATCTDNEDGTAMSRASSVSVRDKNNGGKKFTRRRRDSDTFETRANYVACAPVYGQSQQPTWVQPQFVSANTQYSAPVQQQQYPAAMQPLYGVPNQAYPPVVPSGGYGPQYNSVPNVSESVKLRMGQH